MRAFLTLFFSFSLFNLVCLGQVKESSARIYNEKAVSTLVESENKKEGFLSFSDEISFRISKSEKLIEMGYFYTAIDLLKQNTDLPEDVKIKQAMQVAKSHLLLANAFEKIVNIEKFLLHINSYHKYVLIAAPGKEIYTALYLSYISRYYNMRLLVEKGLKYSTQSIALYHKNKQDAFLIPEHLIYINHLFSLRNNTKDFGLKRRYKDSILFIVQKKYPGFHIEKTQAIISANMIEIDFVSDLELEKGLLKKKKIEAAHLLIKLLNKEVENTKVHIGKYNPYAARYESLISLLYYYLKLNDEALIHIEKSICYNTANNMLPNNYFSPNNNILANACYWKSLILKALYDDKGDISYLFENEKNLNYLKKTWQLYIEDRILSSHDFNTNHYINNPYAEIQSNYSKLYLHTRNPLYKQKIFESGELAKHYSMQYLLHKKDKSQVEKNHQPNYIAFENLLFKINSNEYEFQNLEQLFKKIEVTPLNLKTSSFTEVKKSLTAKQALISYSEYKTARETLLFAQVITPLSDTILFLPQNLTELFQNSENLMNLSMENNDVALFQEKGHEYYLQLFSPIVQILSPETKELILIRSPSIEKLNIHFNILIKEKTGSSSFKNLNYIGNYFAISYPLSATNYLKNRRPKGENKHPVTLFVAENPSLAQLQYKNSFIDNIKKMYEVTIVAGKDCNKKNLIRHLKTDKVVVVLSHGKGSETEAVNENGLFLSDGFFSMQDVASVRTNCEMLVLAGCSTGVGFGSSEGTINLARAFQLAGAQSLVISSNDIDENSTLKILEYMLHFLSEGKSKSVALKLAQEEYLSKTTSRKSNPSYWANLKLIDNARLIRIEKKKTITTYALVLIFSVISVLGVLSLKKILH